MPPTLPGTEDSPGDRRDSDSHPSSVSEPVWQILDDDEDVEPEDNTAAMYGYQILSPNSDVIVPSYSEDLSSDNEDQVDGSLAQIPIEESVQNSTTNSIEMDQEHIEKIKDVMKNITLPNCNMPTWSTLVPEEEWKSALMGKITSQSDADHSSKTTNKRSDVDESSTSVKDI